MSAPSARIPQEQMSYIGEELELFAHAVNWKRYVRSVIGDALQGDVLEVGAGLGGTTRVFCDESCRSWTALEPDDRLASTMRQNVAGNAFDVPVKVVTGTTSSLSQSDRFDCVLYMDVLEHIDRDREEMERAAAHLRPGGRIVALSPAHQWLYSPFDARIGHYRRYSRQRVISLTPAGCELERVQFLDCVGILASAANRLLLKQSDPTASQISLWDSRMVPVSRRVDRALGYRLGKSILGVWRRSAAT